MPSNWLHNFRTISKPIPLLPPVTTATRWERLLALIITGKLRRNVNESHRQTDVNSECIEERINGAHSCPRGIIQESGAEKRVIIIIILKQYKE